MQAIPKLVWIIQMWNVNKMNHRLCGHCVNRYFIKDPFTGFYKCVNYFPNKTGTSCLEHIYEK